jgi:hypothetical protein
MDPPVGCAGPELMVHAEAFTGSAEQCQQHDREGIQQQEAIASSRVGDTQNAEPHIEAQIPGVAGTQVLSSRASSSGG